MEDEGGREDFLFKVDLGEGVVEATEGVAEEGARTLIRSRGDLGSTC